MNSSANAPATSTGQTATGSGSSVSGVSGTSGVNTDRPVTTGSTPSTTTTTTTSTATNTTGVLKPERIVLRGMTKADLEAAPQFRKNAAANDSATPARSGNNR